MHRPFSLGYGVRLILDNKHKSSLILNIHLFECCIRKRQPRGASVYAAGLCRCYVAKIGSHSRHIELKPECLPHRMLTTSHFRKARYAWYTHFAFVQDCVQTPFWDEVVCNMNCYEPRAVPMRLANVQSNHLVTLGGMWRYRCPRDQRNIKTYIQRQRT
jgi:hypothetical protein